MNRAIAVDDLHYAYPDGQTALEGVTFDVERGEKVALLGPNGAGKTTLALHLNGIRRPDRGTVAIDGTVLDDSSVGEIRRLVGLVFQSPDDQLFMPTVGEDVAFGPANLGWRGDRLQQAVREALVEVGAAGLEHRVPHHLSGGERRKVALATVLSMDPTVLVLDEPTSGLDPAGRRELIGVLDALGMTQVVITHDLHLAVELCDRTLIMDGGRIVADGPTRELLANEQLLARHRLELPYRL